MNVLRKLSSLNKSDIIQFFVCGFLFAAFAISASAQQETGQIIGTVTDPNNAVISNASVVVKNVDRGNEITVQTSSEGVYVIPNLQPAAYDVTVNAQGFEAKTERVQVTVGAKLTVNTQLGVAGAQANTVDVVAGGVAEINTTDQQISNVVTTKQILELPTLTRNPYDLVSLSGNISDADPDGSTGRGVGASINGQRSSSTNILLDGVENVDTFVADVGLQTPLDSVGEFRVITSNFSAEYGRASGGIVNATTIAGTNSFRGSVYAFNRNSKFASNGFDNNANGAPRAQFNRNQFGYRLSGPIVKDKLFFTNSTEWTRVRSNDTEFVYVPTAAFIAAAAPATRAYFAQFGTLAPNGTPTGVTFGTDPRVGGGTTPLFQQIALTIPADAGGGFPQNSYSTVTRIDYNLSDRTQIFGRYALENERPFAGDYDFSPYEGFTVGTNGRNQNALVSATHQFSSNFISQTKLAYTRQTEGNTVGADPNTPTLSGNFGAPDGSSIFFPGFLSTAPGIGLPTSGTQHLGQVNQDLTYVFENHNFRFGGQYIYIQDNKLFPAYQNASQILGFSRTTAVNNFLNGTLQSFDAAINPQGAFPGQTIITPVSAPDFSRSNRYNEFALYFNDSWRIIPRLTLNLGLRYEFYGVQRNKDPRIESNFYFGTGSTIQERIRTGSVQTTEQTGNLYNPDRNNFAPRVGIAYDLTGDGKTSIRGGYGLAYERNFGNVTFNVIQNPPNYGVISITPIDVGGTLPIFTNSTGPLGGSGISRTLTRVSLRAVDPDIKNAYAHFWSAAFEREVFRGTIASATYSGSAGRDLYSISNINRLGTGSRFLNSFGTFPGLTPTDRLNAQYSNINFRGNDGYSNYHGLTLAFDSNDLFNSGLTITNRYTFARTRDNLSSTFSDGYQGNFALGFLDPFDPTLDYGPADFDVRHRLSTSFIFDVPTPKGIENRFLRGALGGFQLTGLINAQSGRPFTVYDCTNALATTCVRFTPTASVNFNASNQGVSEGINTFTLVDLSGQSASDFVDVSGGTEVGPFPENLTRRNAFRGPGSFDLSLGVYKNIGLTERFRLQLRAEAFNVLNRSNLLLNTNSLDFSSGGNVTAFRDGRRNLQFAAKFTF